MDTSKYIDSLWYLLVFSMHLISWTFVYYIAKWKNIKFGNPRRMSDVDKLLHVGGDVDYIDVSIQNGQGQDEYNPDEIFKSEIEISESN